MFFYAGKEEKMSYAIIRNTKEKIWKEYLDTMKEEIKIIQMII